MSIQSSEKALHIDDEHTDYGSSEIWSDSYNKGVSRMDTSMRNPLQA